MISRKLMHKVSNYLQAIMGEIDMAEVEPDPEKRNKRLLAAKNEIHKLTGYLQGRVRDDKPTK
jgi:tmRNA-binding protein